MIGRLEILLAYYLLAVSLEYTATFWVGRSRWLGAVAVVNLVTYPVFFFATPAGLVGDGLRHPNRRGCHCGSRGDGACGALRFQGLAANVPGVICDECL